MLGKHVSSLDGDVSRHLRNGEEDDSTSLKPLFLIPLFSDEQHRFSHSFSLHKSHDKVLKMFLQKLVLLAHFSLLKGSQYPDML